MAAVTYQPLPPPPPGIVRSHEHRIGRRKPDAHTVALPSHPEDQNTITLSATNVVAPPIIKFQELPKEEQERIINRVNEIISQYQQTQNQITHPTNPQYYAGLTHLTPLERLAAYASAHYTARGTVQEDRVHMRYDEVQRLFFHAFQLLPHLDTLDQPAVSDPHRQIVNHYNNTSDTRPIGFYRYAECVATAHDIRNILEGTPVPSVIYVSFLPPKSGVRYPYYTTKSYCGGFFTVNYLHR